MCENFTDIRFNYIDKGEGRILLFLHGNGESLEYFKHQIDYFSDMYRVIALDIRGHGNTTRGSKPFTYSQFVEDLKYFLDYNSIKNIDVIGFSDGGIIAMIFALKYPGYFKKIVLNGASLNPKGLKFYVRMSIKLMFYYYSFVSIFNSKFKINKEMFELMIREPHIDPKELSEIQNEILVIAGKNDMIKESHTILISNSINNSVLKIIDGDHFIANKNSSKFNEVVDEFLK